MGPSARSRIDEISTAQTTYRYAVRAKRQVLNIEYSSVYSSLTAAPAIPLPVPTGLTATPESTSIWLGWAATTNPSYQVEYRIANAPAWQLVTTRNNSLIIESLRAFTTYQFRLRAVGSGTTTYSAYSPTVTSTTLPAAPTWTQIQVYRNSAVMMWQSVPQAASYRVEQRTYNSDGIYFYKAIGASNATTRQWTATGLVPGNVYTYRIVPLSTSGLRMTSPSSAAEINTDQALDRVTNLAASVNGSQVSLTWNNGASDRIYVIRRYNVGTGTYEFLYPPSGTVGAWQDTTAVRGISYRYAIRPVRRIGYIDYTADYSELSSVVIIPLSAPVILPSSYQSPSITWRWQAVPGATSYQVEYGLTSIANRASTTVNSTTYTQSGVLPNQSYSIRVRALATLNAGHSSWTSATHTTPPAAVPALTLNATTLITSDSATLNWTWTAPAGITISGFRIVVAGPGGVPTEHSLGATAKSFSLTGLLASSSYAVSIHALQANGPPLQTVQGTVTTVRLTGQPSLWTMDALTNGAVFDTVLSRHAVAVGGPTIVTGRNGFGTALRLGTGQSLAIDGNTVPVTADNLVNNPQVFTIAAWIMPGAMTQPGVVVGFADPNSGANPVTRDRILGVGSDGRIFFGVFSQGALRQITSNKRVIYANWHRIAASLDATHGMRLYVDGVLEASDVNVKSAEPTRGRWRVGAGNLSGSWGGTVAGQFWGDIDDVRIYLSAENPMTINAWSDPGAALYRPAMFYAN